jgi:hypothetical protein
MKHAIFPFTYALDDEKDTELFLFIAGNAAIWVMIDVGMKRVTKVTANMN